MNNKEIVTQNGWATRWVEEYSNEILFKTFHTKGLLETAAFVSAITQRIVDAGIDDNVQISITSGSTDVVLNAYKEGMLTDTFYDVAAAIDDSFEASER